MSHSQRTSTGHVSSNAEWLDLHFEANRTEYEAALRLVGLQPGWHVLDAACGAGNYLPWIADHVGADGRITALDLAPENVDIVRQRLGLDWNIETPVEAVEGSVLDLPFDADSFDAVWFANTSQYLPDDEFRTALAEFRRVVRPGGLVAIKDMDVGMWAIYPGPAGAFWPVFTHLLESDEWNQIKGLASRLWTMDRWLQRAGFTDVWQQLLPIEWRAPLSETRRAVLEQMLADFGGLMPGLIEDGTMTVSDEVKRFWAIALDPTHPEHPVNSADCYSRDGQIVAVGRVPER